MNKTFERSNGVHETHCCKKHGCKYRDDDCPVEFGDATGIKCEDCDSDFEENVVKNVYIVINRVSGSVFGWIEDPEDFDSLKEKISKTYGIRPELLSYYKLDYIGE